VGKVESWIYTTSIMMLYKAKTSVPTRDRSRRAGCGFRLRNKPELIGLKGTLIRYLGVPPNITSSVSPKSASRQTDKILPVIYKRMSERASWWALTLNNPTDEDRELLKTPPPFVSEIWYQLEHAPTTGTPHFQMCLHTTQQRFAAIKEFLPRAYIEKARNKDALQEYCKKSATSVDGSFTYYKRPTNTIDDPGDVPAERLSFNEIIALIASNVHEDEYHTLEPIDMYNKAVNRIVLRQPQHMDQLTAQRVASSWRVIYDSAIAWFRAATLVDIPTPEDRQPEDWEATLPVLFECECLRDTCETCNFWNP